MICGPNKVLVSTTMWPLLCFSSCTRHTTQSKPSAVEAFCLISQVFHLFSLGTSTITKVLPIALSKEFLKKSPPSLGHRSTANILRLMIEAAAIFLPSSDLPLLAESSKVQLENRRVLQDWWALVWWLWDGYKREAINSPATTTLPAHKRRKWPTPPAPGASKPAGHWKNSSP